MFATLQRVGRSLMLPIAVMPVAALLLRFGQDDVLGIAWLQTEYGVGLNRAIEEPESFDL